jgi:hypothetical protein
MPKDDSWADECIKKAHESHPVVNESVANRLRELLIGKQSERILRGSELINAAKALITDMSTVSTQKTVKNHED